ncbi:MAG: deoxyguanosinetriphosphate triphosphohydrolase [Chthoniobacterales bacterium]
MFKTREQIEKDELLTLGAFAVKAGESLGRPVRESAHPYRTEFQRDRARIIHSAAFRRLDGKTQVFLNGSGDHYRTRLTHTIEVASIARTIARALSLNEDLAEAIALAHDLGHSPFGHSGEETLDRLMKGHGGFDHNVQSLRVVSMLEEKYPRFSGLNLSFEVIEGLKKHDSSYVRPDGSTYLSPSLEAQVADFADEITYSSHDLDDGLDSGLLDTEALEALPIWAEARSLAEPEFRHFKPHEQRGYIIRCIVNREVEDIVIQSARAIEKSGVNSVDAVRAQKARLIGFSPELRKQNAALRKFLFKNLYFNPKVANANQRGCKLLESFFQRLVETPSLLGRKATRRIKSEGLHRAVCDYLSGMTDRYCFEQHQELFGDD